MKADTAVSKQSDSKLSNRLRLIDFIVIIIFLFIAAFSINLFRMDLMRTISLRDVQPIGSVVIKKNIVQRRLADRVLWDRLASESPVYLGDLIRVAELSAATLRIEGGSIDLNENTLIRITKAPDGEGLQIIMGEGALALSSAKDGGKISLDINGRQVQAGSGAALNVTAGESGIRLQVNEGSAQITEGGQAQEIQAGSLVTIEPQGGSLADGSIIRHEEIAAPFNEKHSEGTSDAVPQLQSPAASSVFRFSGEQPAVNFSWEEIDGASSYILEVCDSPDFVSPNIRRESQITFFTSSSLGEGTWYWRVKPVFHSVNAGEPSFSQAGYFKIEQTSIEREREPEAESLSLAQWLLGEIPPELMPVASQPEPAALAAAVSAPAASVPANAAVPAKAAPVTPLPAARNLQPERGHRFTMGELQTQRNISFNWQAVQGANAYILTIFQRADGGRKQVFQTQPLSRPNYRLEDLRFLDVGTFIWQIEAVNRNQGGAIDRRGNIAESAFVMDIVLPGSVKVEGAGIESR